MSTYLGVYEDDGMCFCPQSCTFVGVPLNLQTLYVFVLVWDK